MQWSATVTRILDAPLTGCDVGQLRCERRGNRCIAEFDGWKFSLVVHFGQLGCQASDIELRTVSELRTLQNFLNRHTLL